MNASTVSRVINKNVEVMKSSTGRGRVSDFTSEGYVTKNLEDGTVRVSYTSVSTMISDKSWEYFVVRQAEAIAKIRTCLEANGFTVVSSTDTSFIVR